MSVLTATEKPEGRELVRCGAKLRHAESTCKMAAGWGTDHVGTGRCKLHGGSTSSHKIKAQRELAAAAVVTYGLPREVEPGQALLEEVQRSAGHVAWLQQTVTSLEHQVGMTDTGDLTVGHSGLVQTDGHGNLAPSVWVQMYQTERAHLARVARSAVDAGIAERTVRLAEDEGRLLAAGIGWLLLKLGRDDPDARVLVATMLRSLAGGSVPD